MVPFELIMSDLLSGIASLTKHISNNIPYQIKKFGESVHTIVMNYTEAENLVYEATNEDPWGPTGSQMREIANYTFQYDGFHQVTNLLWKRMLEDNRNAWRRVYKSLTLLNHLLFHGSERVIGNARDHMFQMRSLEQYKYVDEHGRDQGLNVRHRAKVILDLLNDDDKLRAQRKKMKSDNKDRYQGYTSNDMRMGCVAANNCGYIDNYGDEWKGDNSGNYMNKSAHDSSRSGHSSKEVNSFQFSDETRIGSTSPELGFRQEPAPDEDFGEFVWAHSDVQPIAITQAIEIARTGARDIPALPPPVPLFASTGAKSSASVNLIGLDTVISTKSPKAVLGFSEAEVPLSPISPVLRLSDGGMESFEKSAPSHSFFESYSSARIKPDIAFREDWTTTRTLLESSEPKSSFDYTISDSFSAPTPLPLVTSTPLLSSAH
ncbi:hypothetical protein V3C99_018211, partial [Haemonchus contortus]